jgi:hypothetical protein
VEAWRGEWRLQRGVSGATTARGQGRDTKQAGGAYCCFTNCKAATASGLLAPSHPSDFFAKHSCENVRGNAGVYCVSLDSESFYELSKRSLRQAFAAAELFP